MIFNRRTLSQPVTFEGKGLHSGIPVIMTLHPSEKGIEFFYQGVKTKAHPKNVSDTLRCTRLGEISTIEHIMSALAGLEITDALIELNAPEVPGMDGSSRLYVEQLSQAGFSEFGTFEVPDLYSRLFLQKDDVKIAIGKGNGHWRYEFETGERWPHSMHFETTSVIDDYAEQIAPARTFAFSEEIPQIMQMGLGLGLDASSALVLGDDGFKNEARFEDEPPRHKLLDLIGDLYLSGVPIRCLNAVGTRSGHKHHIEMAAMLAEATQK